MSRDFPPLPIVCLLFVCLPPGGALRCLYDRPEVSPERYFYKSGSSWPITIESSDRSSHLLVSHILRILLKEVVGYAEVNIRTGYNSLNATELLDRLSGCRDASCDDEGEVPEAMINLEVWSPAGFNMEPWVNDGHVKDGGPLGPSGRFGWYMPNWMVEKSWYEQKLILDHWRSLKRSHLTEQFREGYDEDLLKSFLTKSDFRTEQSYCTDPQCHKGILINDRCSRPKHKCALLISSYPEQDLGILKSQIDQLGLDVNLAWVGSHLPGLIHHRTRERQPTLFFNWVPNHLTALNNYTRIALPACDVGSENLGTCDFDVHQLSKFTWAKLETHAPEVYHIINKLSFSQHQYEQLLRLYASVNPQFSHSQSKLEETACEWIRSNSHKWSQWIPPNLSSKIKIYLGGMVPLTGPYWRLPGLLPGVQMAINTINQNEKILRNYELEMKIVDTQCKGDIAMKRFMHLINNETHPIAGILGPGCSEIAGPIASLAKHFNTIVVSYSAEALELGNRAIFPLFFRTMPSIKLDTPVLMEICERYNWKRVALMAEDAQEFPKYKNFLKDQCLNHDIKVVYDRKIPKQASMDDAHKFVAELKKTDARIIVLTSFPKTARTVICNAYKMGMIGRNGYVWFLPSTFPQNWWNTSYFNSLQHEDVPCTLQEMLEASQGHLMMGIGFLGPENSTIVSNVTVSDWVHQYQDRLEDLKLPGHATVSYAHDAVWLFALGLDQLLSDDPSALESLHTDATTDALMKTMSQIEFTGVSGLVHFDGAERIGITDIYQFTGNESHHVGRYTPYRVQGDKLELDDDGMVWPSGTVPSDGTEEQRTCSVERFRALIGLSCDDAIVVANILGVASFGSVMLIALILVKRRYDAKVRATRARMEELGLLQDASWRTLDQWEVPRDRVVLNRKLGEGAFGTVYGGEALIDETWLAVAVKTLKIGSNPEEKLDFLSEAEMMKRFDHENIVKLLGVCTRGEPAYTIMEFMLHGDLKTFLVARRQLVGQDSKEAEDVTPERLTAMAKDIASGLKYLTDIKFVHRDLACRNCLVHASKSVKIGDFGMARPIYESDYYRFNKRGMLPVRWMAPESLTDGLFTAASDVWSMGVLLYEIVTFGSFPYQGMSNKQVLESVKAGQRIQLPPQCNEDLRDLMVSCWSFEPEMRPSVDFVLETLTRSLFLVQPCLDAPRTVVALESTDAIEMSLPPTRSRCSRLTLRTQSEHTQLRGSVCSTSSMSNNRVNVSGDSFHVLDSAPNKRFSMNVVIRAPISMLGDLDRRISCASDDPDYPLTHSCHDPDCRVTPTDSSPDAPNMLPGRPHGEERGDSDYCSDNSKEFAQLANNTSCV